MSTPADRPSLHHRLGGPLPALPAPVDAVLELWARGSGRLRALVRGVVAVLVLAAATGGLLRGPWGPTVEVVVARTVVAAGAPVDVAALAVRPWPRDLLPPDALRDVSSVPTGAVANGVLPAGMPVGASQLAAGGLPGLVAPGRAVVPVPADLLPPLPVGARLDVAASGHDGGARVVSTAAVLVADDGTWRWLEVDRQDAPALARAISDRSLLVALLPPPAAGP